MVDMVNPDDPWGFRIPDIWEIRPIKKKKTKLNRTPPARTTRRVGPGHTVVTYAHRTLHYHFKQSDEEYERAKASRRRKAAKGRTKTRRTRGSPYDIYVNKDGSYSTADGRDATYRARYMMDMGSRAMNRMEIGRDDYSLEDMRALLKDDHWEEVCGHKRWNYDAQSTVREFKKYQRRNAGRR